MQSGDPRVPRLPVTSTAITISPDDGTLWLGLPRAILACQPADGTETAAMQQNATSAGYNAYQLLRTTATRADVLAALAVGLDRRDLYRPPSGLRGEPGARRIRPRCAPTTRTSRRARASASSSTPSMPTPTSPRVCAQFSEDLVKAGVDYAPFVTVDGAAPKAVEAKDRQICVEGLEHGQHYSIAFRPGLPAAIGEVLSSPARPVGLHPGPQRHRPLHRRQLRAAGQRAGAAFRSSASTWTVADLKLYRIGDRSLAQLLSGYQFLRQLDGYDVVQHRRPARRAGLGRQARHRARTQQGSHHQLPGRRGAAEPPARRLCADGAGRGRPQRQWDSRATQWFVVSDIGLSTYTGQDGLNVFARSLGTAKPLAGIELTLLARNNEVLGTATTDEQGRATFTPGLTRGEGAMVPAVLMASQGTKDFVFLDMTKAGFDLSDRGVEGRAAPGALDVYT